MSVNYPDTQDISNEVWENSAFLDNHVDELGENGSQTSRYDDGDDNISINYF